MLIMWIIDVATVIGASIVGAGLALFDIQFR